MANSKIDTFLKASVAVLLVALVWVATDTMRERIVTVGDTAPDFKITTDNGRQITRTNFNGRLLVLNFWATWCQPCVEEIPSLDRFQRELASSQVVVLSISVDRNEKIYKSFLKRAGVSYLTARDPDGNISAEYGTFKYPETYIINSKGEVVEKFIGPPTDPGMWMDQRLIERIKRML
jgi:cytochrome c biogenesis protein CcmG, thiol:disulfide interchange protein DsbE